MLLMTREIPSIHSKCAKDQIVVTGNSLHLIHLRLLGQQKVDSIPRHHVNHRFTARPHVRSVVFVAKVRIRVGRWTLQAREATAPTEQLKFASGVHNHGCRVGARKWISHMTYNMDTLRVRMRYIGTGLQVVDSRGKLKTPVACAF